MASFKEKQKTLFKRQKSLREHSTKSELVFLEKLKKLNVKFIFQKGFIEGPNYCIVDFYLPKLKLVIEVDGGYHDTPKRKKRDENVNDYLRSYRHFRVLRITNHLAESISLKDLKALLA